MENIELITEQIKLAYPNSVLVFNKNDEEVLYLDLKPFGKLTLYRNLDILVTYENPFNIGYDYFKKYFEIRLNFENAQTYYYENRINIFKRVGNDYQRTSFENSILRANNYITVAKAIEDFIMYNTINSEP